MDENTIERTEFVANPETSPANTENQTKNCVIMSKSPVSIQDIDSIFKEQKEMDKTRAVFLYLIHKYRRTEFSNENTIRRLNGYDSLKINIFQDKGKMFGKIDCSKCDDIYFSIIMYIRSISAPTRDLLKIQIRSEVSFCFCTF